MLDRDRIRIDSIKLATGDRLLRLTEPVSGFALERKLDERLPVIQQKEQLFQMFEAALRIAQESAA
jgi:hypothetical protein